jgi:hypothetical protein
VKTEIKHQEILKESEGLTPISYAGQTEMSIAENGLPWKHDERRFAANFAKPSESSG